MAGHRARMPREMVWTALAYQKRFWLSASPLERRPRAVAATSLFLACKVDGDPYVEVEALHRAAAEEMGCSLEDMAELEGDLMLGLRFHLTVHHPSLALDALLRSAGDRLREAGSDLSDALRARVYTFADVAMTSDAPLLATPPQLALAVVSAALSTRGGLAPVLGPFEPSESSRALRAELDEALAPPKDGAPPVAALIRPLTAAILDAAAVLDLSTRAKALEARRRAAANPAFR